MSPLYAALLITAVILVGAAEWPRILKLLPSRPRRQARPSSHRGRPEEESQLFSDSVQRDLDALPTISDEELRRKL